MLQATFKCDYVLTEVASFAIAWWFLVQKSDQLLCPAFLHPRFPPPPQVPMVNMTSRMVYLCFGFQCLLLLFGAKCFYVYFWGEYKN